nr:MAG TPA: Acyl-CoA carboxylase epsilon subunit [Inoviridae sp.]
MTSDRKNAFAVIGGARSEEEAAALIEALRRPCRGSDALFVSLCSCVRV